MRRFWTFAFLAAIAVACLSCIAVVDRPIGDSQPIVSLIQLRPDRDEPILFGPVTVTYELTVFNPTVHTVVLRAVDLRSTGEGRYALERQTRTMHLPVSPGETVSARIHVSAWGKSGQASAYESVTIEGIAWFAAPHHRRMPISFITTP